MANDNRDQEYRNEDDPDFVVPIPLNNSPGGTNTAYVPYVATNRPYEGLTDEMAEANDNPEGEHDGHDSARYKSSDGRIDAEIDDHLTQHSYIDTTEVTVMVKDGKVTLEGTVPDADQKNYVEEIVAKIDGVTEVNNRLKVKKTQDNLLQNTSGKQ